MNRQPFLLIAITALGLVVSGCSSDEEEKQDHVLKEKTQTIDTAREVEGMLKGAAEKQKKAADESGN